MNRNLRTNLTCVVLILLAVLLGCSDSGNTSEEAPKKMIPTAYVGTWTGADGSTMTIRNDGSGDYKSGGTSMSGASVEVDEASKEIRFSLLLFDSKYKIDEPPNRNKMKLDGMEYRRTGGFDEADSEDESNNQVPDETELQTLAVETLKSLDRAVQSDDFGEFYDSASEMLKRQVTAADLRKSFADTVRDKDDFKLKENAPLTFTTKPVLKNDNDTFDVTGTYPTNIGRKMSFELRYVREYGEWKLLGVYLNRKSPANKT